jgi:hypothetical protein
MAGLLVGLFPALSGTIKKGLREVPGYVFFSHAGIFVKVIIAALLRLLTISLGVGGTSSQMVIAQVNG